MKKSKITCAQLLKLIPDDLLDNLAQETGVNHQVKKLYGQTLFNLFLYTQLNTERISQRVIEKCHNSPEFSLLDKNSANSIDHSAISKRLASIKAEYFEKIFLNLSKKLNLGKLQLSNGRKINLSIFDSTLVSISSKLLETEIKTCKKGGKNHIKFTTEIHNGLFAGTKIFTEKSYTSEDIALREAILNSQYSKKSIVVFDRGLQKRATFEEFDQNGIVFVSRLKNNVRYEVVKEHKKIKGRKTDTLKFKKDQIVRLKNSGKNKIDTELRMITAKSLETKETIIFITNNKNLNAREITEIYKLRWQIEIMFKFIKQELNFKHLVSRDLNGIQVMLYMTLITAILLTAYKTINGLKGYKMVKIEFRNELFLEILRGAVAFCDGDLHKFDRWKTRFDP